MESTYKVYAKHKDNLVYRIYSTCFEEVQEEDVFIKEGSGDEFVHVGYYKVFDFDGCYNYKIVDGEMVEMTEEEKNEWRQSQPKPQQPLSNQELTDVVTQLILSSL